MAIKFSNLASTTLASGVSSTATSVSVTSASSFPTLGSGDYFYATIGAGSGSEIVKVTGISGTTFTVSRGEDGTTAVSHSAGVDVALRVTAGTLEDLRDGGQVYTAGSGLGLSGNEFTNTAPDQTVSISGSGSTTVTGTYPSFTVSSTSYSHPSAHPISFITGLQTALDGKVDDSQVLTDVPANALFTDTVYTHPTNHSISFITGLQSALDGKVDDSQVLTNVPSGALFTDTVYTLPFTDNSTNWNTAYGWGDHSTGGYLTSHQSLSGYATETYVGTQISNLVDSSPAALNTLNELAAALGDDPNFATTVSTSIGTKLPLAGGTLTGTLAMGANAITSTGTISSGAITNTNTSGLGIQTSGYSLLSAANNARAASGSLRLGNGAGSTGFVLDYTDQGQTVATIRNAYVASNTSELTIQSPFITFDTGTSYTEALKLDHNQNAIFAGTISSGAITASGDITAASGILTVKPTSGGGGQIGLGDWTNTNPIGISEGLWNTVASDNDYITVYARSSFNIRGYAGGTTHWLAMTGSAFNLVASQALQIGGTTVIDASRNLTNIGTISSGAITSTGNSTHGGYSSWTAGSGTGGIFMHYNASSSYRGYFDWRTLQLGNNGANNVLFGNTSTGGYGRFYVNSTGISQSGGTSGIHAFSMLATGEVVKEANERFTIKSHTNSWAGGMRMISATGAYTFQIHPDDNGWMYVDQIWNFNGDIKMGNTTIIDSSRNLTNINAITSTGVAALTRGNGSVGAPNTANHDTGTRIELYNSSATAWYAIGIESDTMWFNSDNHYRFYTDAVSKVDFDSSGVVNAVGGYKVNGTTVIDSSRNITAGTISSGAITSTGATSSFGPGSGATYIRIGDQVTDNNPGGWNKGVHLNSLNHGRFRIRTTNYTYGALETYYWADSSVTPSMGIYGNTSTFKFTGSITTLQNSSGNTFFHAGNDGSGSGLDADLLDGVQGSGYVKTDGSNPAFVKVPANYTGNLNSISNAGVYFTEATGSVSNNPFSSSGSFLQFGDAGGVDVRLQFYAKSSLDRIAFRNQWGNGNWGGWHEFWTTQNDGSGSGLDADLLDGQQPSALSVNYANTAGSAPANGGTATALNGSHYISRRGGSGNYNTDFTNVPAGAMNHQGDDANSTNNPGGTWWFLDNYRHSNSTNYWGTQVAWGWEDNANTLRQRNVLGGNYSGWVNYWNSGNDGSGSGLDADLLDGAQATSFLRSDAVTTGTTITASDAFRSSRWEDGGGTFLFREASGSGRARHLNLADTTGDPSGVTDAQNPTGISWGQRSDNNGYYMLGLKGAYNNGYSTYSRLVVGWHTGLEIGANPSYGGTRFFSDSPYVTSTEIMSVGKGDSNVRVSNNLFCNGVTETPKLYLNGGNYEGQIVFGAVDYWRCGIRQHDDGDAELRIWAKSTAGRVHIATGYDGQPANISRPTDGFVVDNNRVGIGNFAGSDPSTKLHVKGETTFAGAANTTFATPNLMSYGSSNSAGVANYHIRFVANNGNSNGNISTNYYQTTYATTSDYRVKEDLQPMLNATSRLMSLNPVNFQWKDSDMRTDGFLAHEVAEVVTDAVVGEKDAVDEQGNDELQSLDQSKLVPLLVKTIQEQQSVIEALEGRISALEA